MDYNYDYDHLFAETKMMLEWARTHLPPYYYEKIKISYDKLTTGTILCFVFCIPIIVAFVLITIFTPFSNNTKNNNLPNGATTSREASIDYDGNFYWAHDSKRYEEALADYGLNPDDYEFGDKVTIYIDDEQNVYKVTEFTEKPFSLNTEVIIGCLGASITPILTLIVYLLISFNTFGKPFRRYRKWYNKRNSTIEELYMLLS